MMGESFKAVCCLVLMVSAIWGAVTWVLDPGPLMWVLRIGLPLLAISMIVVLFSLQMRSDLVPDYLGKQFTNYYNRDGFCFSLAVDEAHGVCNMLLYFQNQYAHPCRARVAVRPARGFFLQRPDIETLLIDIDVEPAAFGIASSPISIPLLLQGKSQSFEVGASVEYPQGKGTRLRFGDGIFLRSNSQFGNRFGTGLMLAGALSGQIVFVSPASMKVELPHGVATELPFPVSQQIMTVWKLGDELLPDG